MKDKPENVKLNQSMAIRVIVNVLCNGGFMNGWFGDVGREFREKQVTLLWNLPSIARREWIESNRFNLTHYCRVPGWLLQRAATETWDLDVNSDKLERCP